MVTPSQFCEARQADELPIAQVSRGVLGSKDGRGIGHLVDCVTIEDWLNVYLVGGTSPSGTERAVLELAFKFGVRSEGQYPGQSFIEAEPKIRSEWSSERGREPWDTVRDAIWAGFDRARNLAI